MSVLRRLLLPGASRATLSLAFAFLAAVLLAASRPSQAAPTLVRLRGHVPSAAVARAQPLGRVAQDESIRLALTLPLRDPAGLQAFLARLYDPAAPEYGHYLSGSEFTRRFGPTQQSYDAVLAFARARGLKITGTTPNRLLVNVSGTASTVESAFAIHLLRYENADGRVFHAPDAEPAIPATLAGRLTGVIGLANNALARPHYQRAPKTDIESLTPRLQANATGSGPGGGLTPADIRTLYDLNKVTQTGTGRTLALYELDGYTPDDITTYENSYGLPLVPLQNILVGQADGTAGGGAIEVTLDIELMAAVAPGATSILVYEGKNGTADVLTTYNRIATDNIAKEVSTSWGLSELYTDPNIVSAQSAIFQQMAAQGQSMYAASGDSGAYDDGFTLSVDDPASQAFVTGVGGTKLSGSSAGGPYVSEVAWGDPSEPGRDIFGNQDAYGAGGGGGYSAITPLPDYQSGITAASTSYRNVPDVSLEADYKTGYSIYCTTGGETGFDVFGGTSCAAPLWAAYTALVNQVRVGQKQSPLGFANPTLYTIAKGPNYAKGFHDVTGGSTNLFYATGPGYDNATGLGSFDGAGLLPLVAPPPTVSNNPLASLTLNPPTVVGGLTSAGTVTLSNPAGSGGATVLLTSSDTTTATVPASVTIAPGGLSAKFTITTVAVQALKPVTITALLGQGSLTAALQVIPPLGSIAPMSLAFNPAHVCGGGVSTGTVTLNSPAPAGGLPVALTSSDASAAVPGSITVAAGATTATFSVATSIVGQDTAVTITATANNASQTGALTVQAASLEPFLLDVATITGGRQLSASINLSCPAPPGGSTITLVSDNPAVVSVPASVTVPTGSTVGTFAVTTSAVASTVDVKVTATYNSQMRDVSLTVQPGGLVGFLLTPTSVTGGGSSAATLTLDTPAPAGGLIVTLSSDTPGAATVPASAVIPGGSSTAAFPITTVGVSAVTVAKITATLNGTPLTATLTVLPIQVTGLTINPLRVILGGTATGTVTVNVPAPAGGLSVSLSSGSPSVTVPASVIVPAGGVTATFTATGAAVGTANLAAALGGQTQTASLSVLSAPGTTYPAGLNLMSAPYDYTGQSLDSVFGYAGVRLAVWQPGSGAYVLTPSAPADALRPGQGYWVNLPRALALTSVGVPADATTDFSLPLQAGWNQIGDPFPISIKLSGLQAQSGGTTLPFAQAVSGTAPLLSALVYSYTPATVKAGGVYVYVTADGSLQPGQGYWLYAYKAVTLVIPHPAQ